MATISLPSPASRPLEGRALLLARSVWLALVALQLVSFVPLLPKYLPLAEHPCSEECLLTSQRAQALTSAGISLNVYVGSLLVVTVLNLLLVSTLAGILFVRRSHEVMALITAYFALILPTSLALNSAPSVTSALQTTAFSVPPVVDLTIGTMQGGIIYGMLLLFPSGRFVPRQSWAFLLGFVAFTVVWSVWPELQATLILILGWPFFFVSVGACIGYRYWRVSTPFERQQTKWVLFGFLAFMLASQAYWLPSLFTPLGDTVYAPLSYLGYEFVLPVVPITFFIAIQRYRLYDIDVIIRRTLIYGLLTAIVAGVYVVGVIGVQALVNAIAHSPGTASSPVLIVVTTLVIAALFQPLRQRIQRFIDHRFYRSKYDTRKTLEAFGATLRQEVDLRELCERLLAVTQETMQPAYVSLWLRSPERNKQLS